MVLIGVADGLYMCAGEFLLVASLSVFALNVVTDLADRISISATLLLTTLAFKLLTAAQLPAIR